MVPLNGAAIDFSRLRMQCVVVFLEGLHRHVMSFGKRKDAEKRTREKSNNVNRPIMHKADGAI